MPDFLHNGLANGYHRDLMLPADFWPRLWREIKNLVPLFRYLILQTETHAFCLALACAALIGFFPSCLVMMSILKNTLQWQSAYDVMLEMVQGFFLSGNGDRDFIMRTLQHRFSAFGAGIPLTSLLWVLLGAAGVFIPLEAGLNRLWHVKEDRPYWKNQIVGFFLTVICTGLGLLSILTSTVFLAPFRFELLHNIMPWISFVVFQIVTTGFFILSILALYKILPNKKILTVDVWPAAVLAGVLVEIVKLIYFGLAPNLEGTQGPFAISVTFLGLAYIETFVFLGCAFLASQRDRYPWIGFLPGTRNPVSTTPAPPVS